MPGTAKVEERVEQQVEQDDLDGVAFDTVLRGYDRRQVDERLVVLRADLANAEDGLRSAQQRASVVESELEQARAKLTQRSDTDMENSFGFRVERILRLAEAEAKQVRGRADKEANELLKQANADAEARRRQAEHDLAARIEAAERDVVEREAAVAQRERQLEANSAAARRETDQLRAAARNEAEVVRREARAEADALHTSAHTDAENLMASARAEADKMIADADLTVTEREHAGERELDRLTSLSDEIDGRLQVTWNLLQTHFSGPTGAGLVQQQESGEPSEPDGDTERSAQNGGGASRDGNGRTMSPAVVKSA